MDNLLLPGYACIREMGCMEGPGIKPLLSPFPAVGGLGSFNKLFLVVEGGESLALRTCRDGPLLPRGSHLMGPLFPSPAGFTPLMGPPPKLIEFILAPIGCPCGCFVGGANTTGLGLGILGRTLALRRSSLAITSSEKVTLRFVGMDTRRGFFSTPRFFILEGE